MATQNPSPALSDNVRRTTVEALLRQINTDASHLVDLAQFACEKPSDGTVTDVLNAAELVTASAKALLEISGIDRPGDDDR
jgi:hypothetical protein